MHYKVIDQRALKISQNFKKCEAELLDIIMQIASGRLSVCKVKKITSVINKDNQDHWIDLAQKATHKKIEREVALAHPKGAIPEKMTYLPTTSQTIEKVQLKANTPRVKMELGISEKLMLKIRRAQDLVSQKKQKNTNIESTLETLVDEFIKKHAPLEKAKRQEMRGKLCQGKRATQSDRSGSNLRPMKSTTNSSPSKNAVPQVNDRHEKLVARQVQNGREVISARVKHQVYLKYKGRCSADEGKGKRCQNTRFLEIHHIKPVALGGSNELSNLKLLCSSHHKAIHCS